MDDMRSCVKMGCRWPAVATLSYRYATAEVWLTDLGEPHPATHDLCPHHADALRVPRGWTLVDTRVPVEAPKEPSAAEIVERATALRSNVRSMLAEVAPPPPRPPSRYDALLAQLPVMVPDDVGGGPGAEDHQVAADQGPATGNRARARAHELVSIGAGSDLAPIIREIAAELAGPVVGPIQIDLSDVRPTPDTTGDRQYVGAHEVGAHEIGGGEDGGGNVRGGEVVGGDVGGGGVDGGEAPQGREVQGGEVGRSPDDGVVDRADDARGAAVQAAVPLDVAGADGPEATDDEPAGAEPEEPRGAVIVQLPLRTFAEADGDSSVE